MNIYTHKHHIVPRHAGGSDDPSNLVELTVEDHAIAHKVLYNIHKKEEDRIAWLALSGQIGQSEAKHLAVKLGGRKGGLAQKNKPKNYTIWNKGLHNPLGAANGKKGAAKLRETIKGRFRVIDSEGKLRWQYPKNHPKFNPDLPGGNKSPP